MRDGSQRELTPLAKVSNGHRTTRVDIVCEPQISVKALPGDLWAAVLAPDDWKIDTRMEPVFGDPERIGGVFDVYSGPNQREPAVRATNVEMIRNRRRTLKLQQLPSLTLVGYASWSIEPLAGECLLSYRVLMEHWREIPDLTYDDPHAVKRLENDLNAEFLGRFNRELQHLKDRLEANY